MAGVAEGTMGAGMIETRSGGLLSAEILGDLASAEAVWRALEADPACLATPYQRLAWVGAYLRATGEAARVAVVRDAGGRVRILLPLALGIERGVSVARTVGAAHANYHLPVFAARDAAALPPAEIHAALVAAGRAAGIDAFLLQHQPRIWDGTVNPLAAGGEAEADDAYGLFLGPDPEATVRRVFSADARKKLRSKEKRLVEAKGAIAYRRAETPEEVRDILAAFHAQKAARFAAMGVANPYADGAVHRFLEIAAGGPDPAIELHALRLCADGRVLAVFGGAVSGDRYSGMMTAFDADPEVARFSPGDLLLQHLVREQTERGRQGFDLGIGEARYKASICDETIELVERVIPVTLRGRAYGLARLGFVRAKRRIKRNPRLFGAVKRLRALRG